MYNSKDLFPRMIGQPCNTPFKCIKATAGVAKKNKKPDYLRSWNGIYAVRVYANLCTFEYKFQF